MAEGDLKACYILGSPFNNPARQKFINDCNLIVKDLSGWTEPIHLLPGESITFDHNTPASTCKVVIRNQDSCNFVNSLSLSSVAPLLSEALKLCVNVNHGGGWGAMIDNPLLVFSVNQYAIPLPSYTPWLRQKSSHVSLALTTCE